MDIQLIIGKAGTAKSHTIAKMIINHVNNDESWVALAFTNSAVNNLKQIVKSHMVTEAHRLHAEARDEYDSCFKTIHSFFRIDIETGDSFGASYIPQFIYIDEISLVSFQLLNIIFDAINRPASIQSKLVIVGDLLQINPIYDSIDTWVDLKKFRDINLKSIDYHSTLNMLSHLSKNIYCYTYQQQRIFRASNKIVMTRNYRSNDFVMKVINAMCFERMSGQSLQFIENLLQSDHSVIELIKQNYVLLAGRYKTLDKFYKMYVHYASTPPDFIVNNSIDGVTRHFKTLHLSKGDKVYMTANVGDIRNGEIATVVNVDRYTGSMKLRSESIEFIVNPINSVSDMSETYRSNTKATRYPVMPYQFMTIHKSQGLSIDNVIVSLDDIDESPMVYTALSRARNDVKLTISDPDSFKNIVIKINRDMRLLDHVIYGDSAGFDRRNDS